MAKEYEGFPWLRCLIKFAFALFAAYCIGFRDSGTRGNSSKNVYFPSDMPLDSDVFIVPNGYNSPQQVHITQGDHSGNGVIISWVTPEEPGPNTVSYRPENDERWSTAEASLLLNYNYFNYTSGFIHHCIINGLQYDTKYYYEVGAGISARNFWFTTPPEPGPDVPYTFGIIGDLGQTEDSNRTLTHYERNPWKGQTVLFLGDMSYADTYPFHDNTRWDTWGRFVERSVAFQPWIWTAGNHELDFAPELDETLPFKPYTSWFHVPYKASGSTSPLWYSVKRASAYVIILSSYSAFGTYTPQYKWFTNEVQKVDRKETPWLILLVHCPLYSSYTHHYMQGESMRVLYEPLLIHAKVDIVFSGHVHAYERSERISNVAYNIVNGKCTPTANPSAPMYITVGDGGNLEGLVTQMTEPKPAYSVHREASFGHGIFGIRNRTHARFSWHRNEDDYSAEADSVWVLNRFWSFSQVMSV